MTNKQNNDDKHSNINNENEMIPSASKNELTPIILNGEAIPKNFSIEPNGTLIMYIRNSKGKETPIEIAEKVYIISSRSIEVSDAKAGNELEEYWTIKWIQDGMVATATHRKDLIFKNIDMINLPIHPNRIKENKEFLYEFKKVNEFIIETKKMGSKLGWRKDGFLLPNTFIDNTGKETDEYSFNENKPGMKDIVESTKPKGRLSRWENLVESLIEYPLAIVGVYVSFASVLASKLEANTFIFEWAGITTSGKSTALRLAASVWGNPASETGGIFQSWNTTVVGVEQKVNALNHLPIFLDDTKQNKNSHDISNLAYMLAQGQGRARGRTKNGEVGMHEITKWKNIALSTGEQKITQFSRDGGAAGRALIITDSIFGPNNEEVVDKINRDVKRYHGLAGKEFVKFIMENRDSLEDWQDELYDLEDAYAKSETNDVMKRLSKNMALIEFTAKYVHQCFGWDWDYKQIVSTAWKTIKDNNEEADRPRQAYEAVIDNIHRFESRFISSKNGEVPSNCYGEWFITGEVDGVPQKENVVRIYTTVMKEILKQEGFVEFETIMSQMKSRKFLANTAKGKNYVRYTRNGKKVSFYELDLTILDNEE